MNEIINPYIAGAPVTESSMFFGREEVFSWIGRSLAGKYVDHILVLHGQRRVGKTSVLKQIPNFLGDKYIQVFFDLQGRTNTTLDRFLWWVARETARTLTRDHGIDVPRPDRQAFQEDTEYLITEFFPSLRSLLGERILLLTFDEFDTLAQEDIQDNLAKPLIAYLRRLMDLDGLNFIYSIGSSGNKLENMQAAYTDFFKTALYRKVSFLDQKSCRQLIANPVEGVVDYDRQAIKLIYEITAGHPYFTQLMCHELFSLCQRTGGREISRGDVESVVEDVIERGTVNLKFVWDEASDLEKWALASLAQLEPETSKQNLGKMLHEQRVRFVDNDLSSVMLHLQDKDVLTRDNAFVIYLMRLWLQQNRPLDRVREELAEINPIANRFIEIGDEYCARGQFDNALNSYQQALEAAPRYLNAQLSIATTLFETKAYQEAVDAFEKSLVIEPGNIAAQTGLCDALLLLGDKSLAAEETESAVQHYQQILTINHAHTDARQRLAGIQSKRAEALLANGQDDEALNAFNQAIEFTPEDEELFARYNQVLEEKKAKVIDGWLKKADRALKRQRWEDAAGFIEEALKFDPENRDLQARLAETKDAPRQFKIREYKQSAEQALGRGNFKKAITSIETAVALAPEDASLAEWLESTRENQLNAQLNLYQEQAEKAIAAGDWDAAIAARKTALKLSPDDVDLQKKLANTEAAQLQAQLDAFQKQAEQAMGNENWDAAIAAYKAAGKLAPGDSAWDEKIEATKAAQLQAQLDDFQKQAEQALGVENWDAAIAAYKAAGKLALGDSSWDAKIEATKAARLQSQLDAFQKQADEAVEEGRWDEALLAIREAVQISPDKAAWQAKLTEIEAALHQSQLDACRTEANAAREAENWDAAIAALEGYLELEPGEEKIRAEIESIRREKRRDLLSTFKVRAKTATSEEKWDEAAQAWENYLDLGPDDEAEIEEPLQHARKYAAISSDYTEAREALRKKNFGRAVKLLQGVIAQDPAYKSTSRLLVEAVEAKGQAPVWKSSWVFPAVGAILLVILGIIFVPRVIEWTAFLKPANTPISSPTLTTTITPTVTITSSPTATMTPTPHPAQTFAEPILAYAADTPPDFEEDFSTPQDYWSSHYFIYDSELTLTDLVSDGVIHIRDNEFNEWYDFTDEKIFGKNFALRFDFMFDETARASEVFFQIRGSETYRSYRFSLGANGYWSIQPEWPDVNYSPPIREGNLELTRNQFYTLTLMALDDQFAIYLDDEPLAYLEDPNLEGLENLLGASAAPSAGTMSCDLHLDIDNIQFWDLDEMGSEAQETPAPTPHPAQTFAEPILAYAAEHAPTFEDDFSEINQAWGELNQDLHISDFEVDGALHLDLQPGDADWSEVFLTGDFLGANDFILQFEYYVVEADENTMIGVDYRMENGPQDLLYWMAINASSGRVQGNYIEEVDITKVGGVGQWVSFKLFALGDQFAVYLDDIPAAYHENNAYSGSVNRISVFTKDERAQIDIDNVEFWNLDGVEFDTQEAPTPTPTEEMPIPMEEASTLSEPFLTYINSTSPTFEDDFSTVKSDWGKHSEFSYVTEYIAGGQLSIDEHIEFNSGDAVTYDKGIPGLTFPINGLFGATDFSLQFDFSFPDNASTKDLIGVHFRSPYDPNNAYDQNMGYALKFSHEGSWTLRKDDNKTLIAEGEVSLSGGFNTLFLIVQGDYLAIFVNDELIYEKVDLSLDVSGRFTEIALYGPQVRHFFKFDNVKYWDLDGVEFP